MTFPRISLCLLGFISLLSPWLKLAAFSPTEDGLYAVFQTGAGEFTARLDYEAVPLTVANFVGLATGEKAWLNWTDGSVRQNQPFYDGLTFHRVIKNFMIQGGSPNGQGTDSAGYRFPDAWNASRTHASAGVLSMANSGPNSNGSQFFITLAPTPHLDYKHTVFGQIIEGMENVQAIGNTATGANDRPTTPQVIESVTIVAQGAAAEAFDWRTLPLPRISQGQAGNTTGDLPPSTIGWKDGNMQVDTRVGPAADVLIFHSNDLQNWQFLNEHVALLGTTGYEGAPDDYPAQSFALNPDATRQSGFFRWALSDRAPQINQAGRQLHLQLGTQDDLKLTFDSITTGSYDYNNGSINNQITYYAYLPLGDDRAQLIIQFTGLPPLQVYLTAGSSGSVTAYVLAASPFALTGTFEWIQP